MKTDHLASLGAKVIPRSEFLQHVHQRVGQPELVWQSGLVDQQGLYL